MAANKDTQFISLHSKTRTKWARARKRHIKKLDSSFGKCSSVHALVKIGSISRGAVGAAGVSIREGARTGILLTCLIGAHSFSFSSQHPDSWPRRSISMTDIKFNCLIGCNKTGNKDDFVWGTARLNKLRELARNWLRLGRFSFFFFLLKMNLRLGVRVSLSDWSVCEREDSVIVCMLLCYMGFFFSVW